MNSKVLHSLVSAALTGLVVTAPASSMDQEVKAPRGIVDCLLPGQLRRVGGNIYQTPPRPGRLTASECTIRGGDFLLFDRANYETSLKHWISQAERGSGDADAMLYVGEIFEQGIGRDPDFATAAAWYQKAADAGNTTAMISLAHLYKTGQGVPLDLEAAQALYSQAFGSDIPMPLDPTSVKGADQRIETLVAEVDAVRRQKLAVEVELQAANAQLDEARGALDGALALEGGSGQIAELRATVAKQRSEILAYEQRLQSIHAESEELRALRQQLEQQNLEIKTLQDLLAQKETSVELAQAQLAQQQAALDQKQAEFNSRLAEPAPNGEALQALSAQLDARREDLKTLEAALRKAEEERNFYMALASDSASKEERVAVLKTRVAVLEQQLGNTQGQFDSLSSALATTRQQLDTQIATAAAAAQAAETVSAARAAEIERLRAAVARAEGETGRHESDLERLSRQSAELEFLRASLEREQAQSNRLQQLLVESQDRFASSNKRVQEVSAAHQVLEEEVAALRASATDPALLRQRETELHSARNELDTLQAEIASTEEEFRRYKQQMADTATRQSRAIEDLRLAVATGRAEREQLEAQLSSASQQLASAKADLQRQAQRHAALQDEVREARVQAESDQTLLATKQQALDAETQRVASLEQEIERLNQQSNRYAAQINELKARTQAQKIDFVGPKIILAEPGEGLLAAAAAPTRGGGLATRGIAVVAASSPRETRAIRGYVEAPAGLASLSVNTIPVAFDDNHAFAQTIELQGEHTPIRIVARDASGKEAVKEFEYRLGASKVYSKEARLEDSLLGGLRYYALLIANEDYDDEKNFASDLKTPVADVKAIGKVLEEDYGFDVEYVINATYDEMEDALERVTYREQRDDDPNNDKDAILIYYAGHGFAGRVMGDNVRYFWMPVDAVEESPRTWYETIDINKYLKASSIPQIMIVADSCYAGNMPSRDGLVDDREPAHSPDFARFVKKRTQMKSRFVFTSGANEPVLDEGGDGHSVFAREFLNVLLENEGLLAAPELLGRIAPRVERISATLGKEQTPYFGYLASAGHNFGEFFLPAPRKGGRGRASDAGGLVIDSSSAVASNANR